MFPWKWRWELETTGWRRINFLVQTFSSILNTFPADTGDLKHMAVPAYRQTGLFQKICGDIPKNLGNPREI